ncbi:MAG TPA: hypothetical protein VHV74_10420 [Pseudonocardiaceae bacterium]|nr:hypothetical protein [Pseudonocardiaceae bacterium]
MRSSSATTRSDAARPAGPTRHVARDLVDAIGDCEKAMLDYGFAAVRASERATGGGRAAGPDQVRLDFGRQMPNIRAHSTCEAPSTA